MSDAADHPKDVGSLAEEAAKLFAAFSGLAREHTGDVSEGVSVSADEGDASARDLSDHLATGSAECAVCPACLTARALRQMSPEVKAHLSSAATSLVQAATTLLAARLTGDDAKSVHVERITRDVE